MSRRKKKDFLTDFFEIISTLIYLTFRVITWLFCVIIRFGYFLWSIYGYSKSEYYRVTHKSLSELIFDKGAYGEYLIYRHLDKKLQGDHQWLFNVYLPRENDRTTEIDVILFCSSGIYIFESKNYKGWIFGSEDRRVWVQCIKSSENTRARKYRFLNPIMQNKLHVSCFKKQLNKEQLQIPVYSIILFGNRCNLKKIKSISNGHKVLRLKQLTKNIRDLIPDTSAGDAHNIQSVYERLYPMTQVSKEVKKKHVEDIQMALKDAEKAVDGEMNSSCVRDYSDEILIDETEDSVGYLNESVMEKSQDELICSWCGGKLVERTAKSGANAGKVFYGCSNFPKCRFTRTK
jgi:hypothetical protein